MGLMERRGFVGEASRIRAACANGVGSGHCGTLQELRNLRVVEKALKSSGLFVWVYESASQEALSCGDVSGRWCFGRPGGQLGGSLVWLKQEEHVVELLTGESLAALSGVDFSLRGGTLVSVRGGSAEGVGEGESTSEEPQRLALDCRGACGTRARRTGERGKLFK